MRHLCDLWRICLPYGLLRKKSVNSTQKTMEEVVKRIKLMSKDLGGTEILAPLQNIYRKPSITGHPLRLFVFTDGEVAETFSVI
ncbi:von Willebrand factor A domain-containing protein 5A-like isoform X2 [Marmota marmota marmota]|uniref:von Willebrand factor A domain-containing protein 5A-like isoform X2 n=1 Tax=Marmota marmota marmota TaxID=9994 RepID=UPI0020933FE4|nr:von Willebrand factor A domain-containing protein 5A-like isoform X2 [Marmota marmota marmota]